MNTVAAQRSSFPVSEGIGIFVGVVAWDLLAEGHMDVVKAAAIAIPCALLWYAFRCWRTNHKD